MMDQHFNYSLKTIIGESSILIIRYENTMMDQNGTVRCIKDIFHITFCIVYVMIKFVTVLLLASMVSMSGGTAASCGPFEFSL